MWPWWYLAWAYHIVALCSSCGWRRYLIVSFILRLFSPLSSAIIVPVYKGKGKKLRGYFTYFSYWKAPWAHFTTKNDPSVEAKGDTSLHTDSISTWYFLWWSYWSCPGGHRRLHSGRVTGIPMFLWFRKRIWLCGVLCPPPLPLQLIRTFFRVSLTWRLFS